MTPNPYAPPVAPVEDVPEGGIGAKPRRPLSVWTLQVLATLAVAWIGLQSLTDMARLDREWRLMLDGAITSVLLATIVGSQLRHRLARWSGLALIALAFLLLAWMNEEFVTSSLGRGTRVPALGEVLFYLVFACVPLLPTAFWFWHFGFSAQSQAWFAPSGAAAKPGPRP